MRIAKKSTSKDKLQPAPSSRSFRISILFLILGLFLGVISNEPLKNLKANLSLLFEAESVEVLTEENDLPTLDLDIKYKDFSRIAQKRNEAIRLNALRSSDDDFVKGKISHGSKTVDCKLRLKGDLAQHWSGSKWSLRVHTRKENSIFGMSRFSLQDPVTRNHTYEWLFLKNLRLEKILGPRYMFVNLKMNGKPMGVYAIEEHFSKELIEDQRKREGVVLCFDEHYMWNLHWNLSWPSTYRTSGIEIRNSNKVSESPSLSKQRETAVNLLRSFQERKLSGAQVFNAEKTGKFLALSHLWGAEHGLSYADINFYFDPITAKLEPIGLDAKPNQTPLNPQNYFREGEMEDTWVNYALRSPEIAFAYVRALDRFSKPAYLSMLKKQLEKEELHFRRILTNEQFLENRHSIWRSKRFLVESNPWDNLENRTEVIRRGLDDSKIALIFGRTKKVDQKQGIEITIRNALTQPIEVLGFKYSGQHWKAKDSIVSPDKKAAFLCSADDNVVLPPNKWAMDSPRTDHRFAFFPDASEQGKTNPSENEPVIAKVRIFGLDKFLELEVDMDGKTFKPKALPFASINESTHENIPWIREEGDKLHITKGVHLVTEDLFIPRRFSLVIEEGTCLKFAKDTVMISEGAIIAKGTAENPITFTSADESWGGALITNAKKRSKLEHLHFSNAVGIGPSLQNQGIERFGWMLTGALTFHECDVDILNCKFSGLRSEDALNLISSDFRMLGCFFADVSSDALDGDFVQGLIKDCQFERIGGDAIDVSGSDVSIEEVRVQSVFDKGLSAGEGSSVIISNSSFHDVSYAIASKDLSEVKASKIKVRYAKKSALAAYQKKEVFGPAKIEITELHIEETSKRHLAETGSSITLNGEPLDTVELDVDTLYEKEELPDQDGNP
jgi:hypothetical protein